jgi:serine phosphatase RsbU (regulator of sigma subunit)/anti-sigma regulatory factor (Ser/Thr protein kinase)
MISRVRGDVAKGSWLWSLRVSEAMAFGTVVLLLLVLHVADVPTRKYAIGLALAGSAAALLWGLYRVLLPDPERRSWGAYVGMAVGLAYASWGYALLRGEVPAIHMIFVPVIVAVALLSSLPQALAVSASAVGAYFIIGQLTGGIALVAAVLNGAVFMLAGVTAGLLAGELRSHYRGEKESHRLATAVRHRLLAVLDAVDEAIVFRDRKGTLRLVNERAERLFEVRSDEYLGTPAVELLRRIARQTEDPEGFMETFQELLDDPDKELRVSIEQIIPARRKLRLYSAPARDESGTLVGRIDVYTDVTESVRRADEVERLYDEARRTAESYQRSFLPDQIPSLPRLSMVARYIPAAGRRGVCGDFYDVMSLPDGRVLVTLGDVCGTGPPAVADTALTRYTLRSFAGELQDPAELLTRLNSHVAAQLPASRFVRLLVGVLEPERARFGYANGGHAPPVVYRAETGEVEWLAEGGMALGIDAETDYKSGWITLEPGDMLLLYTDGVTEALRRGRPFGQAKLGDIVQQYGVGTPGELVQAVRRRVQAWVAGTGMRDDIALLACQVVPDTILEEPARELVIPNEPERISEVRRFTGEFLADIRAPVDVSQEIQLAVGEAAANAARYGRTPDGSASEVRIHCLYERPQLTVTVADEGRGFEAREVDAHGLPDVFASGGRGLFLMHQMMDEVDVSSSEEGTIVTLRRLIPEPTEVPAAG